MSRFYVIILIVVAFVVLPSKIEALGQTWVEREKAGFDYTKGLSEESGHVVVTITHLEPDFIQDFLNEFFAHSRHQGYLVVLLSPCDLDNRMKLLLKTPLWSHRVIYIRGTALKDEDLERAHMPTARACFILSARHVKEKNASDEQTILRSWAVADFAPNVPQYVQIFGQEMKVHIARAAVVICEDEFKYSLLANNCICPAISTFITLLMHTSRGKEGQKSNEAWQRIYGFHSGNEIYDISVSESKFFEEYVGKSFTYASFHAHQLYGVCLVGVKQDAEGAKIMLNPGESHVLQPFDRLYYIALTSEESLREFHLKQKECSQLSSRLADIENNLHEEDWLRQSKKRTFLTKLANKRRKNESSSLIQLSTPPINRSSARLEHMDNVEGTLDSSRLSSYSHTETYEDKKKTEDYKCDVCSPDVCLAKRTRKIQPPIIGSYTSATVTICHMLKVIKPLCCLELNEKCKHSSFTTAQDYNWHNPVIVAVDKITSGIYNVLFPLRAFYLSVHDLQPIIFLLELDRKERPSQSFLETIAWFPEVFWMKGKLSSLDDLLVAGICEAEHVIVLKENSNMEDEFVSRTNFGIDIGADCTTIITARKIHRMFPGLKLTTELTYSSNMRFLSNSQFDSDVYSMQQSRCEERERKRGSNLAFMFRLPFSSGNVFSAHMLDRLLYQSFLKNYLVDFIKILLSMDQSPGSGYLSSLTITEEDLWIRTYGCLYQKLCAYAADVPIGIFRSEKMKKSTLKPSEFDCSSNEYISQMVLQRLQALGLSSANYIAKNLAGLSGSIDKTVSYVIINPSADLQLNAGDVVYILRAPSLLNENAQMSVPNPKVGLRRFLKLTKQAGNLSSLTSDR